MSDTPGFLERSQEGVTVADQLVLPSRSVDAEEVPHSPGSARTGRHSPPQQRSAAPGQHAMTVAARGVLALLFGLSVLLWPEVSVPGLAVAVAFYAVLVAAGLVGTGVTDARDPHQPRGAYLVAGLCSALVGLMSLLWPQITGLALVVLVGAWVISIGLLELTAVLAHLLGDPAPLGQRRVRLGRGLIALAGSVSVIAGIVVLLRPDAEADALATVLGVYALVSAAVLLAAAWFLRPGSPPWSS
ncbi:hypothetical protein E9549_18445 [Blastococcus sp. MG754426]|uniref:HdeD family acid-resistance protein n=1 Tax=unclassified Blastococcus TaxID=2619396 RepID=UPI001EF128F2|nr:MULTISPECIES: DUF308 domain-containing protein [unclassified Blastococcus]MCF6509367.1 hypothetical protein [Blastococcus sp. MG754426]MCF6513875.1 hypothetical protein [Blastococcus sp. MG754427]